MGDRARFLSRPTISHRFTRLPASPSPPLLSSPSSCRATVAGNQPVQLVSRQRRSLPSLSSLCLAMGDWAHLSSRPTISFLSMSPTASCFSFHSPSPSPFLPERLWPVVGRPPLRGFTLSPGCAPSFLFLPCGSDGQQGPPIEPAHHSRCSLRLSVSPSSALLAACRATVAHYYPALPSRLSIFSFTAVWMGNGAPCSSRPLFPLSPTALRPFFFPRFSSPSWRNVSS